ncbi:cyclin-dependent kinase inhibitor 1 [Helicoverpa armigera]|nr:cyclin-dependent kinase inhibitor 1 [Helicoverpa armigera]XP_021190416.1 cyclin-dependent kinase inhibitor 1 [Helicoverpa armigera]XP_021190417.1 cyclin-dependent kinase inhibitor 1 [Helicoverpa armigera]XP_047027540.1 cyclin-dependent kinase inhibitor 1-like [Helicoverpa zea]XP_047027541.1 cyclin-dependent kinase inhibitor 1-like [Helicoverpa zea]XP_047027542.1 cyclin-dependent kinase inhibitor 1-like [Helicoverpa zea]
MLSVKCAVFRCSDSVGKMSTLSVRAPGLQATTVLDTRSLRVHGVTALEGVRRNLFGCTDREENRRFVERELARQLELDSQRWGFDFANEKPLPTSQRFAWQLVPASTIPAALRRSPITITTTPAAKAPTQEPKVSSPETSKTQKRITDFLKPRKRLSASGKKSPASPKCGHGAHIRPPKVARLAPAHKRTS